MRRLAFLGTLVLTAGGIFAQSIWTEDWDAALAQAQRENKDLLVNFSGSDWCTWCQKLDREVFSTESFKSQAPRDFILVTLDFPRNTPQTPAVRTRNRELQNRYGVEGFPTILLMDSLGRPYARTGYKQGGPQAYLRELNSFRVAKARDWSLLEQAENAVGIQKARLLDQFYERMEAAENASFFADLIPQIISLDSADQAGLRTKYGIKRDFDALRSGLNDGSDWTRVVRDLAALEARAATARQPLLQQDIMMTRAAINLNVLENRVEARKIMDAVRTLDPASRWGVQIPGLIQRLNL